VLLEGQALRALVGTVETQIGQLDRPLAVMSLPSVTLGIISSGATWPCSPRWGRPVP
jgi:hypothetical protein